MENNKISFGFSKVTKKTNLLQVKPKNEENKIELIECLEGQSIKVKDAVEVIKQPLIIPIKASSSKSLADRIREAKEKRVKTEVEDRPDSELSIDELAARELIKEAQNRNNIKTDATKVHTLPISEDKFVAEGEEESKLEDYENVPIADYGMAMLRGMGWEEGRAIGKKSTGLTKPILPELRPKGLGLGANKMVKKPQQVIDKNGKELVLVKGAFARIIAGSHKGQFCEVQGLDDDNCRIIVKTSLTNNVLTLNEFLLLPVTAQDYALGSKVIYNVKYEEYKERTEDREKTRHDDSSKRHKKKKNRNRSRSRSPDRSKKSKHKKSKSKSKYRSSSSDSDKDHNRQRDRR